MINSNRDYRKSAVPADVEASQKSLEPRGREWVHRPNGGPIIRPREAGSRNPMNPKAFSAESELNLSGFSQKKFAQPHQMGSQNLSPPNLYLRVSRAAPRRGAARNLRDVAGVCGWSRPKQAVGLLTGAATESAH